MSFPGGIQFTNSGFLLSSKTLIGKQVIFTRLAVGDGELSGQSPLELNGLIHEVESIDINKLQVMSDTEAVVGGPFTNQGLLTGFWWREIGIYATDPDTLAEKLYCYGNAGALADYIPAGGGAEILEKQTDIWIMASATDNIAASINSSLVYASAQDLTDHVGDGAAHGATVAATALTMMMRDAGGRAKVADPIEGLDIVNKQSLDSLISAATVLAKMLTVDGAGSLLDADKLDGQQGSYYLPAGCYTAADVLAKLMGVDGVGSLLDADLLDGQHGNYYLPASTYTAADVLAKFKTVDGPGSGADADSTDGVHFRNTSGYLEYSIDGVVWNPVGTKLVKPSTTLRHQMDTQRSFTGASSNFMIVGILRPRFSGTVKITADVYTSGNGTGQLYVILPVSNVTGSPVGVLENLINTFAAIGSVVSSPKGISMIGSASCSGNWQAIPAAEIAITEGVPVIYALWGTAGQTIMVRNIRTYYDDLTITEVVN